MCLSELLRATVLASNLQADIESFVLRSNLVSSSVVAWPSNLIGLYVPNALPHAISREDAAKLIRIYMSEGTFDISCAKKDIVEDAVDRKQNIKSGKDNGRKNSIKIKSVSEKCKHLVAINEVIITTTSFLDWVKSKFIEDSHLVGELLSTILTPVGTSGRILVSNDSISNTRKAEMIIENIELLKERSLLFGTAKHILEMHCDLDASEGKSFVGSPNSIDSADIGKENTPDYLLEAVENAEAMARSKEIYDKLLKSGELSTEIERHAERIMAPFYSTVRVVSVLSRLINGERQHTLLSDGIPDEEMQKFIDEVWVIIEKTSIKAYIQEAKHAVSRKNQVFPYFFQLLTFC